MYPAPNPLLTKLNADQCIHGIYIQTPSADCIEMAASAKFDYAIIDCEHGSIGFTEMVTMIRAAEASGIVPIVRVPSVDPTVIRRALEAGALGIYVPDIRTAHDAEIAVAAARFGQADGRRGRGACPTVRAASGGTKEWNNFVNWTNSNIMVTLLVESMEGLSNLDDILKVQGIDAIALGRFDLAHELGLNGDRYGNKINELFNKFHSAATAANVYVIARLTETGTDVSRREYAEWVSRGARIFNMGSDREFISRIFHQVIGVLGASK